MAEAFEAHLPDPFEMSFDQLFVLLAGTRVNAGAEATGRDYRERELIAVPSNPEPEEGNGNGDPRDDSQRQEEKEGADERPHT